MKDRYIVDTAIRYINQAQDTPGSVASYCDATLDISGELSITVRFTRDPKAQKEEKGPITPAEPESPKTPEGGFATGGIVDKPTIGLFGHYTPQTDREAVVPIHLDGRKIGEAVCRFDPKLTDITLGFARQAYGISGYVGRSAEAVEARTVAGVEEHRARPENGAVGGERDESPKPRA